MNINIIVNGANGKMGQATVAAINASNDLNLVAKTGRDDNLAELIASTKADVVVDFTTPKTIYQTIQTIIKSGARPVIGTTGLTLEQITELQKQCKQKSLGGIIAPNFSIGAVLMMRYAQDAAKYFKDAEIIEMHHPNKIDSPSGTAIKTAQLISEARTNLNQNKDDSKSRGELHQGVPIHAMRLNGVVAQQVVIFGGTDETLTIRHDSIHRNAFMPGVCLACREVMKLNHLVYGLENILM